MGKSCKKPRLVLCYRIPWPRSECIVLLSPHQLTVKSYNKAVLFMKLPTQNLLAWEGVLFQFLHIHHPLTFVRKSMRDIVSPPRTRAYLSAPYSSMANQANVVGRLWRVCMPSGGCPICRSHVAEIPRRR